MNVGGSSSFPTPTPIDLDDDDTTVGDKSGPSASTMHARPPGQKAQKAAKKKGRVEESGLIRAQMQRFADQADRDYAHRLLLREEANAAEQRSDDSYTMSVDATKFTPIKRAYWERKQRKIIKREEESSSDPPLPQVPPPDDGLNLTVYEPVSDTQWMP